MRLSSLAMALALALAAPAIAHMELSDPPPLRSKYNPYTNGDVDYDMTSPLLASGANYPCKGYQSLVGTAEGTAVATWQAGNTYTATLAGQTLHNGGSCQFSISTDGAKTFALLKSYIGNCPSGDGAKYDFTIPSDMESHDDAIFAWTWFNNVGNREMYMNCAVVNIDGGGSDNLSNLPTIFVANVANGCGTADSADVNFPNPGADVQVAKAGAVAPVGSGCESGPGADGSTGSDSDWDSSDAATNLARPWTWWRMAAAAGLVALW